MFEKNMKLAYLYDFYQDLLDEHTKSIMRAYYEDDLSLAEIAEGEGISRQGVHHVIKKCEEQLLLLEEKLGIAERASKMDKAVSELCALSEELISKEDSSFREAGMKIRDITMRIAEDNK